MCIPIPRQRLGKHIPAKPTRNRTSIARQRTSKHASLTIEAVLSVWSVPRGYKRTQPEDVTNTHVEVGSNTSTVTLRVVGGDEMGSLKSETVKYGRESKGARTTEWLRWQGPAAHRKDRPVLSSERAPHGNKNVTVRQINIWSRASDGARYQDLLTDWPSVAVWLWLWRYQVKQISRVGSEESSFGTPACQGMSLRTEELNWVESSEFAVAE
jgi:hypothetical protein